MSSLLKANFLSPLPHARHSMSRVAADLIKRSRVWTLWPKPRECRLKMSWRSLDFTAVLVISVSSAQLST